MAEGFSKLLNVFVIGILCVAGYFILGLPKAKVEASSDAFFQSEVASKPGLVLVKFGAEWCPPCRAMESELDTLTTQLHGQGSVVRVDVDQHPALAQHYGVSSIPHLFLFRDGQVVADQVGYQDHAQLLAWMQQHQ